jgi:hypothetical protein
MRETKSPSVVSRGRTIRGASFHLIRAGQLFFGSVVGFTAEGAEGRGGFQLVDHPLDAVFEVKHVEVDQEPYLDAAQLQIRQKLCPHPPSSAILRGLRGLLFRA